MVCLLFFVKDCPQITQIVTQICTNFHSSFSTFHFSFSTFHFSFFTFHFSFFTFHFPLFIFHFSLFIFHFSFFIFHSSLFIFHFPQLRPFSHIVRPERVLSFMSSGVTAKPLSPAV